VDPPAPPRAIAAGGPRPSIAALEAQLRGVRASVEANGAEIARARAGLDVGLARRELVLPTVRVNAKSEVGSGTLIWNGTRQSKARAFVLTAWHIVKDNAPPQQVPVEVDLYEDGHKTAELHATVAARSEPLDLALLELDPGSTRLPSTARLPNPRSLERATVFSRVWAIGCPLGYAPIPTSGELTSKEKELDGTIYWMVNAPTIFGNSGGGIYLADTRELIGVLSRISAYKNLIDVAVPHMGIVTPITAVYDWLDTTDYDFIHKEAIAPAVALPASAKKE
jgi:S1-C subfamily serine protease